MGFFKPIWTKILTTILFSAVILGVGWYLLITPKSQPLSSSQPIPSSQYPKVTQPSPTHILPSPTPLPTNSGQATSTANWKTYSNHVFGFTVKYPPNYYIAKNGGEKEYPKFIDKKYNEGYDPPGLTLDYEPIADIDQAHFIIQSKTFDIINRRDGRYIDVYFTDNQRRKMYATCTVNDWDKSVLSVCNEILASLRFTTNHSE